MAITASFLPLATVRDTFKNAIALNWGGTTPDAIKIALYNNTLTPTPETDPTTYNVAPYNANQVTGTNWPTGGVALGTPTCAIVSTTGINLDGADTSVTGTTLTAARGCLIYDDTLSPKAGVVFVNFGGDYSTNAGTFAITWDTAGIATIDLTP